MKKFYSTFALSFLISFTYAQTFVNLAWKDTIGHPTVINKYVTGTTDIENGMFYIVGNIYMTGEEENFFILKMDASDGSVIWQKDYNGYSASRDFGLDVANKGDYVYMTGLSWDSSAAQSMITTFKLSATTGDTIWTARYVGSYNGYNAAADIAVDDTGNVFISGTEQTGMLNFGMVTLKYDSNGNELWAGRYDSAYMYDAAVAMALDPGKNLAVTGFSGTGFSSWDFVTVGYDPQTGGQLAYNRYGNGSGNFSQPVGIAKDDLDQTFIAGTASHSGQTDIKLIAYDSLMSQMWVHKWGDSLLNEEAVAFENDFNGSFFIGGTQTKANGGKDIVLLKYDKNSGSLIWSKTMSAADPIKEASCKAIANDGNGGCYLTGRMNNGTDFDIVTAHVDADGKLEWFRTFSRGAGTNDDPDDVEYDDNGGVVVTATSMGSDTVYLMLKYEQWNAPNDIVYDTSSTPIYKDKQFIVRFNPTLLKRRFVNNKELQFATITDLLQDSIIDSLSSKIGFDLGRARIGKIFKHLNIADSLNITRGGDTIDAPKFWASVLLYLPPNAPDSLIAIQDSLNAIPQIVFNAGKNLIIQLASYPDDPEYPTSSGHYGSCYRSLCDATQGINVCPVWDDGETGYLGLSIGIFDSGINYGHEEFLNDANTLSKANTGFDFETGFNITTTGQFNDVAASGDGHGTGVASIAAGLSNNSKGGTGVSGGDINGLSQNWGCRLVTMKMDFVAAAAGAYEALVMGATKTPTTAIPGFGIDVANMSWMLALDGSAGGGMPIADKRALQDAVRWLYQNGVVCVSVSGKCEAAYLGYTDAEPASLRDNWIIKVAGSDNSGNGNSTDCPVGNLVDVIAPCMPDQFVPASATGPSDYLNLTSSAYFGTSYSAPLVSGIAGLLMSYYFTAAGFSLSPDDVENLLEIYAKNNQASPFGHGLVDAGNAYNHIKQPAYNIYHYNLEPPNSSNVSQIYSSHNITLIDNYERATSNTFGSPTVFLPAGNYVADVYEVGSNITSWNLAANETIINHWKNNGKTTLWNAPNGSNQVDPESDYTITNFSNNGGTFKGYAYYIISGPNGAVNQWVPVDVSGSHFSNAKLGITLHTYNSALDIGTELQNPTSAIQIYPNPSSTTLTVSVDGFSYEKSEGAIYDVTGSKVWESKFKFSDDNNKFPIDISLFEQGVYTFEIKNSKRKEQAKIVVCR